MSTIDHSQARGRATDPQGRQIAYAQFHHNNFFTTRLTEMRDWYATVLGMRVVFEFPMACWMSNDAASHRLALTQLPAISDDAEKRGHARLLHHAFEYASFEDLNDTYVRLRGEGILPVGCLDHGMSFSYYYSDPDANFVELQVDDFGDWAQSQNFMATSPAFAANPIGAAVDPAKVADAVAAGASFDEVRRRVWDTDDMRPDAFPDLGGPPPGPDDPPLPIKW